MLLQPQCKDSQLPISSQSGADWQCGFCKGWCTVDLLVASTESRSEWRVLVKPLLLPDISKVFDGLWYKSIGNKTTQRHSYVSYLSLLFSVPSSEVCLVPVQMMQWSIVTVLLPLCSVPHCVPVIRQKSSPPKLVFYSFVYWRVFPSHLNTVKQFFQEKSMWLTKIFIQRQIFTFYDIQPSQRYLVLRNVSAAAIYRDTAFQTTIPSSWVTLN